MEKEIYHMSFLFYTLAGFLVTGISSFIASIFFGFNDTSAMNRDLIAPFMHKFMKPSKYNSVELSEKQ